jgi:hypothetical protein
MTLSNGFKFKLQLPESRKVKNSQRNFNKKVTCLFAKHGIKTDIDTPPSERKLPRKLK